MDKLWAPVVSMYVLVASAGLVVAGYSIRARRWQLMLRGAGVNATYREAAPIFFASFAFNNVVPLRAGDLYRCVSTLQLPAGTMAKSLGTQFTERLLDLGALIVLLIALFLFLPQARLGNPLPSSLAFHHEPTTGDQVIYALPARLRFAATGNYKDSANFDCSFLGCALLCHAQAVLMMVSRSDDAGEKPRSA